MTVLGMCTLLFAACDNSSSNATRTETTVVDTDTVSAETTYDVNKKVVEKVDTLEATTEYEVEKELKKRTVQVDTLTEEITKEKQTDFTKGDYEVVDKEVETETVTEEVGIDS